MIVNANYDQYLNGVYQENIKSEYTNARVVEGSSSDITITKTSTGCSIRVAPNPNENSSRTYVVEFTYDSATPVRLTITQNKAEVTYPSSGIVFEHSTQQSSGYKTSTLSIGTVGGEGGNISFYIKSYRSRYVNGSLSSTEAIKPTLILPSGVPESITNVSGYYFKVTLTISENSKTSGRTLTIRANQPNGLDRELVQTAQQSASTYEFGIRENLEDSLSTSLTYSGWPAENSSYNRPVRVYSRKNGNQFLNWALSSNVDWITISGSGAGAIYKVTTNNSSSSRTGVITFTQGESGKTCTLTIVQEAKINNFRLELSLDISNGDLGQDVWGLFDTANLPHTSAFMYDMSLIREGIIVDSVEGKITVNSLQSITTDRGVGDYVYAWAYNPVRGLWLSIGNFRIEEGNNKHHWDVSWPT